VLRQQHQQHGVLDHQLARQLAAQAARCVHLEVARRIRLQDSGQGRM
jgi:hypothetical protein